MSQIVRLKCRIEPCDNIAKALILSVDYDDKDKERAVEAFPVCADHAPEAAHETASCMDADEFLIVELAAFGVGGLT
jgi:hypothetical protein